MDTLKDILTYPYRGSGKYALLFCAVLSVISAVAGLAPGIGSIASLFIGGYFCAVYFQMIQSSATGGKEAPEFPDTANIIEDIVWPAFQIAVVLLVSFGPFAGYSIWAVKDHSTPAIGYCLLAFGVVYFPMAMLAVVVLGYTGALSPHIVIPAIIRGGRLYWAAVVMLCLIYFGESVISRFLSKLFIVETLVMAVVGTYTLMANARILGIVFRGRKEELGWT